MVPASVRSAGLAGAGVAVIGYAGSVFNNPSGIALIRYLSVEAGASQLPDRTTYLMGAGALRIGPIDVGGGYQYLNFSDTASVRDNILWVGTLVYRRGLTALGGSLKYVSVEDTTGQIFRTVTGDLGVTLAFFDIAALALSVQNIAPQAVSGPRLELPRSTHLGFTLNFVDPQAEQWRLLATVEGIWTAGQRGRTVAGIEGGVVLGAVGLVGRMGYGNQPEGFPATRTTYGAGIVLGQVRIDYAYQGKNAFGNNVHWVGVRWTP
ncbi:MAG: hypothetical protein ACOY71_09345 [Gemmatimonadota bacterium]